MTPEKKKACVTDFTKELVTTFQSSRTRSGHISLKKAKERHDPLKWAQIIEPTLCSMLQNSQIWLVVTWSAEFESRLMPRSDMNPKTLFPINEVQSDLGMSLDSKSADQ